jgi:hypothetical protein
MYTHFIFAQNIKRAGLGLLLAAGIVPGAWGQAPVTVTIGTGTSTASTNALFSTSTTTNKYARTVSIFSAAELTAAGAVAGNIVSIAWFKAGTGELTSADTQLNVYMKSTAATLLAVNPVVWATEVVGATTVYSNNALSLPTGTGYKTLTFTTPFAWNGTSNVEVLIDFFRNGTPTADMLWQYTAVGTTGIHATQVSGSAIPTVRFAANRPNTQFVISRTGLASRESRAAALVSAYPNPAHGLLTVAVPASLTNKAVATTLLNSVGQAVHHGTLPLTTDGARGQIDAGTLAAGLYTLRLTTDGGVITKQVVVE